MRASLQLAQQPQHAHAIPPPGTSAVQNARQVSCTPAPHARNPELCNRNAALGACHVGRGGPARTTRTNRAQGEASARLLHCPPAGGAPPPAAAVRVRDAAVVCEVHAQVFSLLVHAQPAQEPQEQEAGAGGGGDPGRDRERACAHARVLSTRQRGELAAARGASGELGRARGGVWQRTEVWAWRHSTTLRTASG